MYVTVVGKNDTDVSILPPLSNLSLPGGQQVKVRASRFTSYTATVVSVRADMFDNYSG